MEDLDVGLELEVCLKVAPESLDLKDLEDLEYFMAVDDGSIVCKGGTPKEFIFKQKQRWFAEKDGVLDEMNNLWDLCKKCENESCGLHVHISCAKFTKKKYANFGHWVLEWWALEEQEKMIDKWELREENSYCEKNLGCWQMESEEKYLLMNIQPWRKDDMWHLEFRGKEGWSGKDDDVGGYVDAVCFLFMRMCGAYLDGQKTRKPYSNEFMLELVSGESYYGKRRWMTPGVDGEDENVRLRRHRDERLELLKRVIDEGRFDPGPKLMKREWQGGRLHCEPEFNFTARAINDLAMFKYLVEDLGWSIEACEWEPVSNKIDVPNDAMDEREGYII